MHEVKFGTNKRMSFSKIKEVLDMPDLIEIQKNSYERFFEGGSWRSAQRHFPYYRLF